jgi:hypothetical protein
LPSQEYFIANDVGFVIESGETDYQQQDLGPITLLTEDGFNIETEGDFINLITEDGYLLSTENGLDVVSEQIDPDSFELLISEQNGNTGYSNLSLPRVDLAISIDGGASFSSYMPYNLNPIGKRRNTLRWWQLGATNEITCQFKFWGLGRFVALNGELNLRQ